MKITQKIDNDQQGFIAVRKYLHAGQQSYPRIFNLQAAPAEELRVVLPTGTNAGQALRDILTKYNRPGGIGLISSGTAKTLKYLRIITKDHPQRPYDYGPEHTLLEAATFITGSITIGKNQQGNFLLHCHSGFIDQHGIAHGGHLLLDSVVVGDDPLILHFSLFSECAYIVNSDEETQFSLLHPTPMESL
jgi:predicted DNA-binding protein with PD1-like motif